MSNIPTHEVRFKIRPARSSDDLEAALRLFNEYVASLGIDLTFQDFQNEVACLPGKYAPPVGEILLVHDLQGDCLGCVALRPLLAEGCCEMKRLYVLPSARRFGLGRTLVDAIVKKAEQIGYTHMRLDTLSTMVAAINMYKNMGFREIPSYYDTPLVDTVFMELTLPKSNGGTNGNVGNN